MDDLQAQFDDLTTQKTALWEKIKHLPDYEFEQTEEFAKIRELDEQLLALDAQIKGGK